MSIIGEFRKVNTKVKPRAVHLLGYPRRLKPLITLGMNVEQGKSAAGFLLRKIHAVSSSVSLHRYRLYNVVYQFSIRFHDNVELKGFFK